MNVENILMQKGTNIATIEPEASIKRAADWLRAKHDIVRALSQYGEPVVSMQVKDIMTHGLITVAPGTTSMA